MEHPIINPNYLSDDEDVRTLIEGCRLAQRICQSEPLSELLTPLAEEMLEPKNFISEDQFWESFVRHYSLTVYHPTGTCKMGSADDPMSVVTQDTKVKGVQGLRVVDASIIPKIVSGNTNIPVIAVAERAADLIKKDNSK